MYELILDIVDVKDLLIPPSQKTTCMHVDECEEKAARRDVTKWASYSCRRDNSALACKGGVNKGTTGMPVGLFSIVYENIRH